MKVKPRTAKRTAKTLRAVPGKRRAAAKSARIGVAAARRDARVQTLLHNETFHKRLRDALVNARVVYLRATRRGDAAAALLDDRKGRRALRRTIDSLREAVGLVRGAKTRRRRRVALLVVPVIVVGAVGALIANRSMRDKVTSLVSSSSDGGRSTAATADRDPAARA